MTLSNETCTIQCDVLTQPSLEGFDIVHNTEAANTSDYYMARAFQIECKDVHSLYIALLDRLCSDSDHYAVLEGHTLTVILFEAIVRIDMNTGAILQRAVCENMGGLNEIHPIEDGYILYGESEVFRYDRPPPPVGIFGQRYTGFFRAQPILLVGRKRDPRPRLPRLALCPRLKWTDRPRIPRIECTSITKTAP